VKSKKVLRGGERGDLHAVQIKVFIVCTKRMVSTRNIAIELIFTLEPNIYIKIHLNRNIY
jgi:hypothetical protein